MQTANSRWLSGLATILATIMASTVGAQEAGSKATLAIRGFQATPAVQAAAKAARTTNALEQILQGAEGQMENSVQQTRKFQIVARGDLKTILKEQDLADSGLVNRLDPNTARSLNLAGAKYVAVLSVDGFQDITDRTVFEDQLGQTRAERRAIQLSGVVKVFDTSSGTMLTSTALKIDKSQLNKIIPGVDQQGRKTDAILATVATALASDTALAITDAVYPAKVLAYSFGVITFNRTKASGVAEGQIWEVMHTGEELVDPDTGEVLGREEVSIGWARVTEAGTSFSKANAIQDRGIEKGSIMRLRPAGLPKELGSGSNTSGGAGGMIAGERPVGAGALSTPGNRVAPDRPETTVATETSAPQAATKPLKLAIFVKNLANDVPASSTGILESDLSACLTNANVSVISRSDLINGVARFAGRSGDTGGGQPESTEVERALSDQASAKNLAALLGADGFIVATINKYTKGSRTFNDPGLGVSTKINEFDLGVALRVVDGSSGGTLLGEMVDARTSLRKTAELDEQVDPLGDLLQQAATNICGRSLTKLKSLRMPADQDATEYNLHIDLVASGLTIPNIHENDKGEMVVGSTSLPLEPIGAQMLIDGVLAGTVPGQVTMSKGLHRLRIEHPMFDPFEKVYNATANGVYVFAMQLSDAGRASWAKNIAIIEAMKNGEVLRTTQLEAVRAFAEFLSNSRITIDTSNVENLNLGGRSIWAQFLDN